MNYMDLSPTILSSDILHRGIHCVSNNSDNLEQTKSISATISNFIPKTILREKVIIVGDEAVGKTSILQWLTSNGAHFPKNYVFTSEADLFVKEIAIPENRGVMVDLVLFDMAGQSIFHQRGLSSRYWKNANFVICVFDVTRRKSLHSCSIWIQSVRATNNIENEITGLLVGNKTDLREGGVDASAEVSSDEAMDFASEHNLEYFECSAFMGLNIDLPFRFIASKAWGKNEGLVRDV